MKEYEKSPMGAVESSIFGRSISELIEDGMRAKLDHMPEDSRKKLSQTLERIMNEGANGLVCILL
jgi:stage IV sporulation protein A